MERQNEVFPIFLLGNIPEKRCRNMNNLVHIKTSKFNVTKQTQGTPDMLRFALINARSLRNKTAVFADLIVEQNIDVCVVTETWLKDNDTASIANICQSGYSFK